MTRTNPMQKKRREGLESYGSNPTKVQKKSRELNGQLTPDVIDELRFSYTKLGWTPLEGKLTVAFVSPTGEFFNTYERASGQRETFGTIWARRAYLYNMGIDEDEY